MAAKVNVRKGIQTGAKVAGGTLTVLVFSLLAYLYSPAGQAKIEVPHIADPLPPGHAVVICRDAPKWVGGEIDKALAFGKAHGIVYGPVTTETCSQLCNANGRFVSCRQGAITVALRDTAFDDEHAGETVWEVDASGKIKWATVLLPEKLFSPEEGSHFPRDAYAITLTHELVGHAEGRGHTKTQIVKGVAAEKTGDFMNASLLKGGWGDAGW